MSYQNDLAMRNTADMTGGKPNTVWSESFLGVLVCAINPLVAFYDIHGRNGEMLIFCTVPDTTRDISLIYNNSDVIQSRRTKEMNSFV
jgi:hypothetical protein